MTALGSFLTNIVAASFSFSTYSLASRCFAIMQYCPCHLTISSSNNSSNYVLAAMTTIAAILTAIKSK